MLSLDATLFLRVLVFPGFLFVLMLIFFCDWVERKVEARMENRVGPLYTGPSGILQPVADFIKLLSKEDLAPSNIRSTVFKVAPLLSFSVLAFAWLFIPVDGSNTILDSGFEGDLIFVMTLMTIANFFLFLSGWASKNAYSSISAARVLTQFLGYDIPLFILALAPSFMASSISISKIASSQLVPFALLAPWAFGLFIITLQAELEKDPFDVPQAEAEVVGGYEVEYAGRRLAFLKLSKDIQIVLGAAITVELFLGGPYGPVLFGAPAVWYTLWFVLKTVAIIVIGEYITCVFSRLRIDQVLDVNWSILLPLSAASLLAAVGVRIWLIPW